MTTGTNKENTKEQQAVQYTVDQIGLKIRQRPDLIYEKGRNILTRRVLMDQLEEIINHEFTKLYHYLKFKKYTVYEYNIKKTLGDLCYRAEIEIEFVWGMELSNTTTLCWKYDWLNNTDVMSIKHH